MEKRKSAVALGLFDGVHLGHRAVLKLSAESGLLPSVFTFSPDAVSEKNAAGYIYGQEEKTKIIHSCGIEKIYSADFNEVRELSGEEFVKNILIGEMNAGFVCCGNNFRFGKNASCGTPELHELGRKYGFEVRTADSVKSDNEIVSSTEIRKALLDGNAVKAAIFLGNPYTISREVIHGAHLGSTIGFPTANQIFESGQLVPKFGVYASRAVIDGEYYRAITDIGIKPTVNYNGLPLAETHIIDFAGDLYGRKIDIEIMEFIRPEMKFTSIDELKKQISGDIEEATSVLI